MFSFFNLEPWSRTEILFLWENLQDDQVYIYKSAAHYTLVEGYPKTLKEELGVEGHVDAAFVCPNQHTVHIIQGKSAGRFILIVLD